MVFDELRATLFGGGFSAGPVGLGAYAGYEIAQVIAKQHDDAMRTCDVFPPRNFGAVPAVFFCQQYMGFVGANTQFPDVAHGRRFLRTRICFAINRITGSVCHEENSDTSFMCRRDETGNTRHRIRRVLIVPLFEFPLFHRGLERHLEFRIADRGFVDIEYNSRWQMRRINLAGLCTPGRVFDKTWQLRLCGLIDLRGNSSIFCCVIYP